MTVKEMIEKGPLARSRVLVSFPYDKGYEEVAKAQLLRDGGKIILEAGVDRKLVELAALLDIDYDDVRATGEEADLTTGTVRTSVYWNRRRDDSRMEVESGVTVIARPLTRELLIEGSGDCEVLSDEQWKSGEILDDALARVYKNPYVMGVHPVMA